MGRVTIHSSFSTILDIITFNQYKKYKTALRLSEELSDKTQSALEKTEIHLKMDNQMEASTLLAELRIFLPYHSSVHV